MFFSPKVVMDAVVAIAVAIVFVAVIVVFLASPCTRRPVAASVESFQLGRDFYLYNYLNYPISVEVSSEGFKETLPDIPSRGRIGLTAEYVAEHFRGGTALGVFVKTPSERVHLSDHVLNLSEDTTIKALHIGMVTSRWVGAGHDDKFIPPDAQQGRPWIKIHNMTNAPLALNNNLIITPRTTFLYKGRDHYGVRLGTIFRDQRDIFPEYRFETPATDIYYGVVSDIQQPLFGGWQVDAEFDDDPQEPYHLLEEGFLGGPAEGSIAYGSLPKDGPVAAPTNRWGEVV